MKSSFLQHRSLSVALLVLGILALVIAGLLFLTAFLNPGFTVPALGSTATPVPTATSSPTSTPVPSATPEPTATSESVAASVNGYTITQSYLSRTVKLNQVLGDLSGAPALSERETLQQLIVSQLILQEVTAADEPSDDEVDDFIARLEESWGVSNKTVDQRLEEAGLDRAFLTKTVKQLLTVQSGVETLESEGHNISEWLRQQEQEADIKVSEELATSEQSEDSPTPIATEEPEAPTPTAKAQPAVLDVAPAFTLKQAGGGRFALEKQLKEGPVVLVFFEKCG